MRCSTFEGRWLCQVNSGQVTALRSLSHRRRLYHLLLGLLGIDLPVHGMQSIEVSLTPAARRQMFMNLQF